MKSAGEIVWIDAVDCRSGLLAAFNSPHRYPRELHHLGGRNRQGWIGVQHSCGLFLITDIRGLCQNTAGRSTSQRVSRLALGCPGQGVTRRTTDEGGRGGNCGPARTRAKAIQHNLCDNIKPHEAKEICRTKLSSLVPHRSAWLFQ
jgi:hypothetical protein